MFKLTPMLFRELDVLSRNEAGTPLVVEEYPMEQPGFAYFSPWAKKVYLNVKINLTGLLCEKSLIVIANQIPIELLREAGVELDWSKIPINLIYHFFVYHEIYHKFYDYFEIELFASRSKPATDILRDRENRMLFSFAREMRADRFAWRRLFPRGPLPIHARHKEMVQRARTFMKEYKQYFPKKPRWTSTPISTNLDEMVPAQHAEKGIPFVV